MAKWLIHITRACVIVTQGMINIIITAHRDKHIHRMTQVPEVRPEIGSYRPGLARNEPISATYILYTNKP